MTDGRFDIRGRRALVTGSSRGIGLALAGGLVEAGCSVALHARDEQALERAAASLGGDVHHVAFDVTDRAAVDAGVAAVEAEIGPLDILVNNAGMQHRAPLLDFPDDAWHQVIETNLTSAFYVGRAVARGMVERGPRQDRQHRLAAVRAGAGRHRALRRQQGRDQDAHARDVRRVGARGRAGQRDRAGLLRHRAHERAGAGRGSSPRG